MYMQHHQATRFTAERNLGRQVLNHSVAKHAHGRTHHAQFMHVLKVAHINHVLRCEKRWSMGFDDMTTHDREVVLANLGRIGRDMARFLVLSIHSNVNP